MLIVYGLGFVFCRWNKIDGAIVKKLEVNHLLTPLYFNSFLVHVIVQRFKVINLLKFLWVEAQLGGSNVAFGSP
jgi:hypothetical protein